ncbi:PREDICTED: glutathione S-transferase T3-like [Camelina sativa]|uniref:Glutathione S-transferase T3-like n=1 Tax=Camelina sativa TaxID=90675 RepID=A0ABM0U6J9_CAMSA|nr:PREDICTED: glutathione S-transferase T3-like [Camelina sativa]
MASRSVEPLELTVGFSRETTAGFLWWDNDDRGYFWWPTANGEVHWLTIRREKPYFVDLLNSQKDSNGSENPILPNTFSSQPVHFTSSFSSQPLHFSQSFSSQPVHFSPASQSEECIEVTVDETEEDRGRGVRKRWSAEEDLNLISAWLNTSKDPVVSNDQRLNSFSKRIADYYKSNDGASGSNARGPSQCKARWSKINHQVNNFGGCYTQASSRKKSGESEDDVISMAYELYKNDQKKPFYLGHCWRELKNDQKWITEECSHKLTKLAPEGAYIPGSSNDGAEMRPLGVKASKEKGRKPTMSNEVEDGSVVKLHKIISMKDQEQAAKERHDKMRLLYSLVNKSELTPAEERLRDKLLDQMSNI